MTVMFHYFPCTRVARYEKSNGSKKTNVFLLRMHLILPNAKESMSRPKLKYRSSLGLHLEDGGRREPRRVSGQMVYFPPCVPGCLRSCTRTTETLSPCSTVAPNWSTGSRPTAKSPPGPNTPRTSCRRCPATTATPSQVAHSLLSSAHKQTLTDTAS